MLHSVLICFLLHAFRVSACRPRLHHRGPNAQFFLVCLGSAWCGLSVCLICHPQPKFAILDECTSAVSDEVEGTIYQTCRLMGITIFTVSHRPQLAKYHEVRPRAGPRTARRILIR